MADLTQFDAVSAGRIARVVRAVEQDPPRARPLTFDPILEQPRRKVFRMGTFSGAWGKGSSKVVTLADASTLSVSNVLWPIPDGPTRNAAIARDGTSWHLVSPEMFSTDAVASVSSAASCAIGVSRIPVLSFASAATATSTVALSGCGDCCTAVQGILTAFTATANIDVLTGVTLDSEALTFERANVRVLMAATASTVQIAITTCATATAS